jgi:hypothetical protein
VSFLEREPETEQQAWPLSSLWLSVRSCDFSLCTPFCHCDTYHDVLTTVSWWCHALEPPKLQTKYFLFFAVSQPQGYRKEKCTDAVSQKRGVAKMTEKNDPRLFLRLLPQLP